MMLWTWQAPAFDPFKDRVDRSKSEFIDQPPHEDLLLAYEELDALLSLPEERKQQYLWCYTTDSWEVHPWGDRLLFSLNVPDEAVLSFVDNSLWERLIGNETVPTSIEESIEHELSARKVFGDSRVEQRTARRREYLRACPSREECLKALLLPTSSGRDVSALVRSPLEQAWIREYDLTVRYRFHIRRPRARSA